eukprot:GHUV01047600.1.p1 GENE.GHUV01047600.1~~GHUV01047600.1.p1  ORF type:complete len:194 (-),score=31.39 GHUV01047600.1:68-649(-)
MMECRPCQLGCCLHWSSAGARSTVDYCCFALVSCCCMYHFLGRLDRMVFCGMPNESERLQILTACARKLALDPDVDFAVLAQQTVNFTSADVAALLSEAQLLAVHDKLDQAVSPDTQQKTGSVGESTSARSPPVISMQHLRRALARARPSLPPTELRRLAAVYGRFQQGRDPGINNRQVLDEGQQRVKHATLA